jgi:RNA polymerase sigma factor (sigma-70 family)
MTENQNLEDTMVTEKVFEEFFRQNYSRLYYFALHYINDSEVCKDIVGEAFRFLWEKKSTINAETMLSYMYSHVRSLCVDSIRHSDVEDSNADSYMQMVIEMNEDSWNDMDERLPIILRIIDDMPTQTRFIMEQHYLQKKKYKEICEIVGLTESGVRKHIMKGLDTIRESLNVKYKKNK